MSDFIRTIYKEQKSQPAAPTEPASVEAGKTPALPKWWVATKPKVGPAWQTRQIVPDGTTNVVYEVVEPVEYPGETAQEAAQGATEQRPEASGEESPDQEQSEQPTVVDAVTTEQDEQYIRDAQDGGLAEAATDRRAGLTKLGLEENPVYVQNFYDDLGRPAGGTATGTGVSIMFQNGPINRDAGEGPNGAFIEQLLEVSAERLRFYQESAFACDENAAALVNIEEALYHLAARRKDRIRRGVLGQHVS